jgi:hypothetical protein
MRATPLFLFLCVSVCQAQLQTFEYANSTIASNGFVRFNNNAELGQKKEDGFDYSDVRGTCFWDNEWNPAILIMKSGKAFKLNNVKLNFYTNEIHYLDNRGTELVTQNNVKNIVFYDRKDTVKLKGVFKRIDGFKIKDVDSFAQLLVEGKTRLLKRKEVKLIKSKDAMLDHPDLKFVSDTFYYVEENGNTINLKNTNKESLFAIIKTTDTDEAWLKENKNKLKSEADIVSFLTYRNAEKK